MSNNFIQLFEMPMSSLNLVGDWGPDAKPRGYDKASIGILTNPTGVEKIQRLWGKVDADFDVYVVRSSKGWKYLEVGEVPYEFLKNNLGLDIPYERDKVTLVFTNNKAAEKIPMTAWTMAHRFSHAAIKKGRMTTQHASNMYKIIDQRLTSIAEVAYGARISSGGYSSYGFSQVENNKDRVFRQLVRTLGTMKSARDNKIFRYAEFLHEAVAQFMITGKITLNHDLKTVLPTRGFAWGKPQGHYNQVRNNGAAKDKLDTLIDNLESDLTFYAEDVIGSSIGKVYVM